MRRIIAGLGLALVIAGSAAASAAADPNYPPTDNGQVLPTVTVSTAVDPATDESEVKTSTVAASLARTGSEVVLLGGAGLALVVTGVLVARSARRGRHS